MTWYVQLGFCNVHFVVSTGEYLDLDHRALQKVPNTFSLCPSGRPFISTGNDEKNNFEHAHVVENIRCTRAQKTRLLFINTSEQ